MSSVFNTTPQPLQIPGAAMWLDAADAATVGLSNNVVTRWRDKISGTVGTNTGNPIYSNVNGLPSVNFGGADYFNFGTSLLNIGTEPFTIFAVARNNTTSNVKGIIGRNTATPSWWVGYNSVNVQSQYTTAGGSINNFTTPNTATSNLGIIGLDVIRTTTQITTINYQNGSLLTPTVTSNYTSAAGAFTLFVGRGPGIFNLFGDICELIAYVGTGTTSAIMTAQRQFIEGYLTNKWGLQSLLPASHPYRNTFANNFGYQLDWSSVAEQSLVSFSNTPSQISGLALWLDGADPFNTGIQPSSGTLISTWSDKSGNGRNATVASNRVEGTYNTALQSVYFQSSNVGYATSYSANPTVETMFIVAKIDAPANQNNNTVIGGQQGARSFGFGFSVSGGIGSSSYLNNEVAWQTTSVTGPTAGTTALITGTVNNRSNVTVSLNGATSGASYTVGTITAWTAGTTTYLAVDTTNRAYYYKGYVMEILFYNSVLPTNQRQQVESYLAQKWGLAGSLPANHLFKTNVYYNVIPIQNITIQPTSLTQGRFLQSGFQPTSLSGLSLWLDGADAATVQFSSGANISNWGDKSGNGRNATQPTTSNQPTYSLNSVVFGQSLFLTTPLSASANTETIYMVTLLSNISYSSAILGQSNGSSGGRQFDIQYTANAGSCTARLIRMNQVFVNVASVPQPANVISLAEYTNNGTSSTIYWNGTAINTSVTPSAFSGTFTTAIGTRGATLLDQFFYGSLFEILVYSNVLADAQRQQVEGYLAWKWGLTGSLPANHPNKNMPPS